MQGSQVTVLRLGLQQWRKTRGWSQEQLAERAGVSTSLIALIESGRRQPGLANAMAIAAALEVPLQAFAVVHVNDEQLRALAAEAVA